MAQPLARPSQTGIVHLGLGAFARAHTFHYTELAAERAGTDAWGIFAVTGRRPEAAEVLRAQEELYGVLFRDGPDAQLRWIGSLTGVAAAGEHDLVTEAIARPTTHVVTVTITEKAYTPDSIPLRLLVRGLLQRHATGGAPLTVLSCDNLLSNGRRLERIVDQATKDQPGGFRRWLRESVAFPCSVVDRITPSATAADRALAGRLSGLADSALVVAEPFGQWVIEDRFAGPRPPWELAGVEFVPDVGAHEAAKLRILNGAHTLIACAGAALGHDTVAGAMSDQRLRRWCETWQQDVQRTLPSLPGTDWGAYARDVRARFSNDGLSHTTHQIARDTSQKIWMRILDPTVSDLAAGRTTEGGALAVGAWAAFVLHQVRAGETLDDPLAPDLDHAVARAQGRVDELVPALLDLVTEGERSVSWGAEFVSAAARRADELLTRRDEFGDGSCRN